ncbi:cell differentiation protein rcd1 [Kwoniella shivajii]|uniref:Cell differentiation protein rcd1 n=1 Tax=Kwoniella shivajii TaxID=564305 RepID=A0ABZ1D6K4_9TREE|nr:cell differentiation protein rcd1 [Kwoniella shivajii]
MYAPPHFPNHLHRPPTAPPTPEGELNAWSSGLPPTGNSSNGGFLNNLNLNSQNQQQQQGLVPPYHNMFDRRNNYPYSNTSGTGQGQGQAGNGMLQQQPLSSNSTNSQNQISNIGLSLPNQNQNDTRSGGGGHTPNLSITMGTSITTPIQLPSSTTSGPLLPQNLAQHLNNPPAPITSSSNQSLTQQQQQQQNQQNINQQNQQGSGNGGTGGKVLLMPNGAPPPTGSDEEKIYILITELLEPETREGALLELSKKRELYEDLALVLWGGYGIMSSLLLEIVAVYPALSPPSLTAHASNRVCNALALLQCVASHSDTRALFLNAHIPLFLYPFLNTTSKTRPFEYLRLTSLGVIGALVKQNDNSDVINFLLSTEIIPLCLRIMETGSELSKTVAIFIVQKILADDLGLQYICQTYERFYAVGAVLANMVDALVESQAVRLLKHVVRCYLRMSDNPRAREALRACLPKALQDNTFTPLLKGDMVTKRCLTTLLVNLNERSE